MEIWKGWPMEWALMVLGVQGVLGAYDNVRNHEFHEGLPHRTTQWRELWLHAARQGFYLVLFPTVAWLELRGVWAWVLGVVILAEMLVTCWDFVEEDRTRKLSANERVLHTVLTLNYGIFLGFFFPVLLTWGQLPTAITVVDHGLLSWLMTVYSAGVLVFGTREFLAGQRLYRNRLCRRDQSLHRETLGPAFDRLPEGLRNAHADASHRVLEGVLEVHSASGIGGILLRFVGLPALRGRQPVTVDISADGKGEFWQRRFPDCVFRSRLETVGPPGSGKIVERFGLVDFYFHWQVDDGAVQWNLTGCHLFGLAVPRFLSPVISARETVSDGNLYYMTAQAAFPMLGPLLSYKGYLGRKDDYKSAQSSTDSHGVWGPRAKAR